MLKNPYLSIEAECQNISLGWPECSTWEAKSYVLLHGATLIYVGRRENSLILQDIIGYLLKVPGTAALNRNSNYQVLASQDRYQHWLSKVLDAMTSENADS